MNKYENFWETEYPFGQFLKKIFPTYQRKYSLEGNGIFNLITLNKKLYEIKYTETKTMGKEDNHKIDADKAEILNTIAKELKVDNYVIYGGKFITFPIDKWIAKVEVIKKLKMPT